MFCSYSAYCVIYLDVVKRTENSIDSRSVLGAIDAQISEQLKAQADDDRGLDSGDKNSAFSKYNDAKKALENAQKTGQGCDEPAQASSSSCVQKASEKVRAALQALEKSGTAGGLEAHKEQLAAVDELLQSIADGKSAATAANSPDQKVALSVAASVPSLEKQIGDSFNRPQVGALVLESERLRLECEALRRDLGRRNSRLALLRDKREAAVNELNLLRRSKKFLALTDTQCKLGSEGLLADYRAFPKEYCREEVAAGLLAYTQSWNAGQKLEERDDYKIIDLSYTESLDNSEFGLLQWQNFIQVPLNQTSAFYSSGIKPEDIAKFLEAAGLAASAVGVNR